MSSSSTSAAADKSTTAVPPSREELRKRLRERMRGGGTPTPAPSASTGVPPQLFAQWTAALAALPASQREAMIQRVEREHGRRVAADLRAASHRMQAEHR